MIRAIGRDAHGAHTYGDWIDHLDVLCCDRLGCSIIDVAVALPLFEWWDQRMSPTEALLMITALA